MVGRRELANIRVYPGTTACLPSLRPILSLISEKLRLLRQRNNHRKRGSELLMDMLPARKPASEPVLPLSRRHSWNDGPNPMLDSSTVLEMESRTQKAPELDAEAPGPHILEIETTEPVLEMESQRYIAELEDQSKYSAEMQRVWG